MGCKERRNIYLFFLIIILRREIKMIKKPAVFLWNKLAKRIFAFAIAGLMIFGLFKPIVSRAEGTTSPKKMNVFSIDAGRKYFSLTQLKEIVDRAATNGYTHLHLLLGNDGLRFTLNDMSVTVEGKTYENAVVKAAIIKGNERYYKDPNGNSLSEAEMAQLLAYAKEKKIMIIPAINSPGHMDAILYAMEELGINNPQFTYNGSKSARTVDLDNKTAIDFTKALLEKYIKYFSGKTDYFNFGADEYANDATSARGWQVLQSTNKYGKFITYVNEIAGMIKKANMKPIAFNDGFYYNRNDSMGKFDTDIIISYWTCGWTGYDVAPATYLVEKGHKILNTNDAWYYVLGRESYNHPSGYSLGKAIENSEKRAYDDVPHRSGTSVESIGSMVCVWCDTPSATYDPNNVFSLMDAFAKNNEKYFKETDPDIDESQTLDIYPKPHSMVFKKGTVKLPGQVHIVRGKDVDEVTVERIKEVFASVKIQTTVSSTKNEGYNVYLEVNSDSNKAQAILDKHKLSLDVSKIDAYQLVIDQEGIAIVGKDTDSVFYGVTSLKHVLAKKGTDLPRLIIDDYANTKIRGFIEGYYGIPWSNENRMSLMKFGGDFKANAYIFAPKDDPYHSKEWRKLYPADQIAKIKEMAKVGNKTKTRFVWTIHPFMGNVKFNANDFDGEMKFLLAKFDQLYDAGIRQFGVLGDDVGSLDKAMVVRMMNKVSEWGKTKGDVKDFVFCPSSYNSGWAWNQSELDTYQKGFPSNVQIFWTGSSTCTPISQYNVDQFRKKGLYDGSTRRDPLFWLNWPVNDVDMTKVFLGPGICLEKGVTNLAGAVTNPMQEAQASKIAIFAVADYAWNTEDFDYSKSWQDSLKYVDPDASKELAVLGTHMTDPGNKGITMPESENIRSLLNIVQEKITNNQSLGGDAVKLKAEMDTIINACNGFMSKSKNEGLKKELEPFIYALRDRCLSIKALIDTQLAIEKKDLGSIWKNYSQALNYNVVANSHKHQKLSGYEIAKPAGKRIQPFFEIINEVIGKRAGEALGFASNSGGTGGETQIISNPFSEIYTADPKSKAKHLYDHNDDTFTWFSFGNRGSYQPGDYIGIDIGTVKSLKTIHLVMGGGTNNDFWTKYVIKVSEDKVKWVDVSEDIVQNAKKQTTDIDLSGKNIKARYIAVFNKEISKNWVQISELHATYPEEVKGNGYSNVAAYKSIETQIKDNVGFLPATKDLTLKPNEYLGIDLTKVKDIREIAVEPKNSKLTVQTSRNGVEWEESGAQPGRYVRLINKTKEDVKFNLDKFEVTSFDILPKKVAGSNYSSSNLDNALAAFDGDFSTAAWYKESQTKGKTITYDLGQTINLKNIKMYVTEGEHDYIRHGIIEVSEDNKSWKKVLSIGNQEGNNQGEDDGSVDEVYPNLTVPYRYLEGKGFNYKTRYIRITLTRSKTGSDKWVRFQEIVLNDGEVLKDSNNPGITSTIDFVRGYDKEKTRDGKLNTYFKADKAGSITYNLRNAKEKPGKIKIYKDNNAADIEVRTIQGWKKIITSDQEYLELDLSKEDVFDLRISWKDKVRINEVQVEYMATDKIYVVDIPTKITAIIDSNSQIASEVLGIDAGIITSVGDLLKDIKDKADREKLAKILKENIIVAYDIDLNKHGKKINVNEKLTLQIPVEKDGKLLKVYHIHGGKLIEYPVNLVRDNSMVEVNADGLSPFVLVYEKAKPTPGEKPNITNNDSNKKQTDSKIRAKKARKKASKTGDVNNLSLIISLLIVSFGGIFFILKKRKSVK